MSLWNLKPGEDIQFMKYRPFFFGLSMVLIFATIVGLFTIGPRFGTDFQGGTELEVAFTKPIDGGKGFVVLSAEGL